MTLLSLLGIANVAHAEQVVQVPLADGVLTARSVTTLTQGKVVPWTVGIDQGGTNPLSAGYMTAAASAFQNGQDGTKALPDDGKFPSDARHPEVVLHFANDADPASQQTRFVAGAGSFTIPIPSASYSKLFVFLTSAEGASALKFTLTYADGSADVSVSLPDYVENIPANDPVLFNLASDLAKWRKQGGVQEHGGHNLSGVELVPDAGRVLNELTLEKGASGYLVFWGATGIATSDVVIGVGGTSAGGAGGAGGASSAGAGGVLATGGGAVVGGNPSAAGGAPVGNVGGTPQVAGAPSAGGSVNQPTAASPRADQSGSCSYGGSGSKPPGLFVLLAIGWIFCGRRFPRL